MTEESDKPLLSKSIIEKRASEYSHGDSFRTAQSRLTSFATAIDKNNLEASGFWSPSELSFKTGYQEDEQKQANIKVSED